jgi:hypothetical protein
MAFVRSLAAVLVASLSCLNFAQSPPERYLRELQGIPELAARQKRAAELLKSVNPSRIEPREGLAYAEVYASVRLYRRQKIAATRFLRTNPTGADAYRAYRHIFEAALGDRDAETAFIALRQANPTTSRDRAEFVRRAATYGAYVIGLQDKHMALDAIEIALGKLQSGDLSGSEASDFRLEVATSKAQILADLGHAASAEKTMRDAAAGFPAESDEARRAQLLARFFGMVGSPAPTALAPFAALPSGQVSAILFYDRNLAASDEALAALGKVSANLRSFGITRVPADSRQEATELAAIAAHREAKAIPFPTSVGSPELYRTMGIATAPAFVGIDRQGKVARVLLGFSREAFDEFRAALARL